MSQNNLEDIDTNIDNYSFDDIISILNLVDPTEFSIKDKSNELIVRMQNESNIELKDFFEKARDKAIDILKSTDENIINESDENLIQNIWADENIIKDDNNIKYFVEGSHILPEKKEILIEKKTYLSKHIISIDSQYRTHILPFSTNNQSNAYNTNFTFNISNTISKVISITLYSYQIPTTWYSFSLENGNTFFIYNGIIINIPDGNYTKQTIVDEINLIASSKPSTSGLEMTYNEKTNKISIKNNDLLTDSVNITFYLQSKTINFNDCDGNSKVVNFQSSGINTTLGWLLGFRPRLSENGDATINLKKLETIETSATIDISGPKYFILSIEDFNTRLSNGLYGIKNEKNGKTISVPDYYKTKDIDCKKREGVLTQSQQYTINSIKESSKQNNNSDSLINKLAGPISSSAFALIPLTNIITLRNNSEPYVKFGSDLEHFKRSYYNPTILDRMNVRLTDDKGRLVNLHDNDWSFSLIVEEQY